MVLVALKRLILGENKPLLPSHRRGYSSTDAADAPDADEASSTSVLSFDGVSHPRVVSDIIIGLSDGLTVPFALTAGLSSLGNAKLVITGGMAELVSGAISMGLGGFLAAKSESEYYQTQIDKELAECRNNSVGLVDRVHDSLSEYHLSTATVKNMLEDLQKNEKTYAKFMVNVVNGTEEPAQGRELTSALTIGLSYFFGGFVPLLPYFFADVVETGFIASVILMIVTLFAFGYLKTIGSLGTDISTHQCVWNGLSMVFTGGFAAGAAWTLVRVIE